MGPVDFALTLGSRPLFPTDICFPQSVMTSRSSYARNLLLGLHLCLVWAFVSVVPLTNAAERTPVPLTPQITGFIQKHCLKCHGEKDPKAGLALHAFKDEASVLKTRKKWTQLIEMVKDGDMPPEGGGRVRPAAADVDAFANAVQALFDNADKNAKPDPGRVTVRRLNRVEYNNTIRDLFGVDIKPAEDFPSDDVGHGFDNIGDVLTLPPVLMERYLAAAENVAQRVILPNPPKPPVRHLSCKYAEPAGGNVAQANFRPISNEKPTSAVESGPLFTRYQLEPENEYLFRTRVYAVAPKDVPVRIAILAAGPNVPDTATDDEAEKLVGAAVKNLRPFSIVQTVEVKAQTAKNAETIQIKLPETMNVDRMAIALYKTPDALIQPMLFVEYFAMEGPLDTRPLSQRRIMECSPDKPQTAQTREIITRFLTKTFRRPPTNAEVERLAKLVDQMVAEGEKHEAAVQLAVQAALASPKFLFRFELDDRPDSPDSHPIDEFQLASRLSYFLWSSMPDDELFELAAKRKLTANLDSQVRRMLQDPKAAALVENFAMQWLQLGRLATFAPDAQLFPAFNEPLRAAMLQETQLFLKEIIREDRSVLEMIDADYTYLNEPLARHYGIADTIGNPLYQKPLMKGGQPIRGPKFVRVLLPGTERGGLLTQASVLTVTSNPTRTSPVKRGRWVLEQLLGTPPPPPPPNVPELDKDDKAALTGSLRQRMEQHRANPACANCHAKMDPLGFAFENYNAIGAFRQKDGEFPIDPSGTLPDGNTFKGPGELKRILAEKRELFARCLTEKMLTYALGRGLEYYDKPAIDRIQIGLKKNEYRFSALVSEIVRSDPFRMRRGKE